MDRFPDRLSCLALAASVVLVAAGGASARSVTLAQAEHIAISQSPKMKSAEAGVIQAEAGVSVARSSMLPTAGLTAGYTRNIELPQFVSGLGKFAIGDTNVYALAFQVRQPIFTGFAATTGHDLAENQVSLATLSKDLTEQTLVSDVRQAYLGAVLARKLVQVQQEAVAQAESSLAQVQLRYNVGAASGFDLLRAKVQLATTRPNLVTAKSNREISVAQLRNAMGLDATADITPSDTLAAYTSRWAGVPFDSLVEIAYTNRPEMRETVYQEQAARYQVKLAESPYYPTVAAIGNLQWEAQVNKFGPSSSDWIRSANVALNLSWTFWDSWKTPASVQSARVGERQISYSTRLLKDGIAVELQSARMRLNEAAANVKSGEETVTQAEEALRLARVLYSQGGSTQLDVIDAQVSLTQAETQYAQALYDYSVADTNMEQALGVIHAS